MPALKLRPKPASVKLVNGRKVVYDRISIKLHDGNRDPVLSAADAKVLVGWTEESEQQKFGKDYLLIDEYGKKIRCLNNLSNRPYRSRNAAKIKQEILHDRWRLNLESMIIGETGALISCQHRLIGLILAAQEWHKNPSEYPAWDTEPYMKCLIAFGCSEDDDVVNTVDTGEPRSIADVIYRMGVFDEFNDYQNEQLSRILDFSIRMLWSRNGVLESHSIFKTHAEAVELLKKHPRLVECAQHIYAENGGVAKKISTWIATGAAAGIMYVMGASATDPKVYEKNPCEDSVDWTYWDQAVEFWVNVASKSKSYGPLFKAIGALGDDGSRDERVSLMMLAWRTIAFTNEPIGAKGLQLVYKMNDDVKVLAELPTIGGIDMPSWSKIHEIQDDDDE